MAAGNLRVSVDTFASKMTQPHVRIVVYSQEDLDPPRADYVVRVDI